VYVNISKDNQYPSYTPKVYVGSKASLALSPDDFGEDGNFNVANSWIVKEKGVELHITLHGKDEVIYTYTPYIQKIILLKVGEGEYSYEIRGLNLFPCSTSFVLQDSGGRKVMIPLNNPSNENATTLQFSDNDISGLNYEKELSLTVVTRDGASSGKVNLILEEHNIEAPSNTIKAWLLIVIFLVVVVIICAIVIILVIVKRQKNVFRGVHSGYFVGKERGMVGTKFVICVDVS
jgi:hypothetical protein